MEGGRRRFHKTKEMALVLKILKNNIKDLFVLMLITVVMIQGLQTGEKYISKLGDLGYFMENPNYSSSCRNLNHIQDCKITIPYDMPEKMIGAVIYEDDGSEIKIYDVEKSENGGLKIYLESSAAYNYFSGGHLVSPVLPIYTENDGWVIKSSNIVVYPEDVCKASYLSRSSVYENFKNTFSIVLTPSEIKVEYITVYFTNLWSFEWKKKTSF